MKPYASNRIPQIALVTLITVAMVLVAVSRGWNGPTLKAWIESWGAWSPVVFIIVSTILMSAFVPKTVISLSAGALFGWAGGSLVVLCVAVLAGTLNFVIGARYLSGHRFDEDTDDISFIRAVLGVASRAGYGLHLLIRLSPLPTMVVSYAMGAVGARYRPFIVAVIAAMIPHLLWVRSGALAMDASAEPDEPRSWVGLVFSIILSIAVTVIVSRAARRQVQQAILDRND